MTLLKTKWNKSKNKDSWWLKEGSWIIYVSQQSGRWKISQRDNSSKKWGIFAPGYLDEKEAMNAWDHSKTHGYLWKRTKSGNWSVYDHQTGIGTVMVERGEKFVFKLTGNATSEWDLAGEDLYEARVYVEAELTQAIQNFQAYDGEIVNSNESTDDLEEFLA